MGRARRARRQGAGGSRPAAHYPERLAEPAPTVVTLDRRDQLRRSHLSISNVLLARIVNAPDNRTRAQAVAEALDVTDFNPADLTEAERAAEAVRAQVARAAELQRERGEATPLERQQRAALEAKRLHLQNGITS